MTKYTQIFLVCLMVSVTFFIYSPGLSGTFMFDDLPNIQANEKLQIDNLNLQEIGQATFSGKSGPLKRPVSMLSFALNYYFTGLNPYFFKLINILIHLVNGILVYFLTIFIMKGYIRTRNKPENFINVNLMALTVASAWLLHPINLTSVLYIVQRMNSLAALFTLFGLITYLAGRLRIIDGKNGFRLILVGFILFGTLAALSKENGLLLGAYIVLIELIIFQFRIQDFMLEKQVMLTVYIIGILFLLIAGAMLFNPPDFLLNGYQTRSFTMTERLLTETRVIWLYLYMIIKPNLDIYSLHHDYILISRDLITPLSTLFSIAGIVGLVLFSCIYRRKMPLIVFGLLFFLLGHSMESSVFALEIAYEHRNYLPSFGILFIVFYCLYSKDYFKNLIKFRQLAACLFIGLLAFNTSLRAQQWSNPVALIFNELNQNPNSSRVNYAAGRFYAIALDSELELDREQVYSMAEHYFIRSYELNPDRNASLISLIILSSSNKKATDEKWFNTLEFNLGNKVIDSTTVVAFDALLTCKLARECVISNDMISRLITATGRNSMVRKYDKAIFYNSVCRYIFAEKNDLEEASRYGQLAIATDPSIIATETCLDNIQTLSESLH